MPISASTASAGSAASTAAPTAADRRERASESALVPARIAGAGLVVLRDVGPGLLIDEAAQLVVGVDEVDDRALDLVEVALDVELDRGARLGLEQAERHAAEDVVDGVALALDRGAQAVDQELGVARLLELVLERAAAVDQAQILQHAAGRVGDADQGVGAGLVGGQDQHLLARRDRHDAGGHAGRVGPGVGGVDPVAQVEQAVGRLERDLPGR